MDDDLLLLLELQLLSLARVLVVGHHLGQEVDVAGKVLELLNTLELLSHEIRSLDSL